MKNFINKIRRPLIYGIFLMVALFISGNEVYAQHDSTAAVVKEAPPKPRPVKNTFQSGQIIDAQTVMVPVKGTFEADIQHRFGSVQKGYQDLWGIYGIADIRFGFLYTPIKNLEIGIRYYQSEYALGRKCQVFNNPAGQCQISGERDLLWKYGCKNSSESG